MRAYYSWTTSKVLSSPLNEGEKLRTGLTSITQGLKAFLQVYTWKLTVHIDLLQSKLIPVYDSKLRSHTHAEIKEIKLEINLMHTYI